MTNSRTKGAAGEREVARILQDQLGIELTRNLDQTRDGGYDLLGLPGWAIEVKRYKTAGKAERQAWWKQAVEQAGEDLQPVVIYRLDRQGWRVMMAWPEELFPIGDMRGIADIDIDLWCAVVRENME